MLSIRELADQLSIWKVQQLEEDLMNLPHSPDVQEMDESADDDIQEIPDSSTFGACTPEHAETPPPPLSPCSRAGTRIRV